MHGKVQPAVRKAIQDQKTIIEQDPIMAAYQDGHHAGFQGTVYVDVYLHHNVKGGYDSKEN